MAGYDRPDGSEVVQEQIATWIAEGGHDYEPPPIIAVHLTPEEIAALDERAQREGKSRSEVIRDALHL